MSVIKHNVPDVIEHYNTDQHLIAVSTGNIFRSNGKLLSPVTKRVLGRNRDQVLFNDLVHLHQVSTALSL